MTMTGIEDKARKLFNEFYQSFRTGQTDRPGEYEGRIKVNGILAKFMLHGLPVGQDNECRTRFEMIIDMGEFNYTLSSDNLGVGFGRKIPLPEVLPTKEELDRLAEVTTTLLYRDTDSSIASKFESLVYSIGTPPRSEYFDLQQILTGEHRQHSWVDKLQAACDEVIKLQIHDKEDYLYFVALNWLNGRVRDYPPRDFNKAMSWKLSGRFIELMDAYKAKCPNAPLTDEVKKWRAMSAADQIAQIQKEDAAQAAITDAYNRATER